MGVGLTWVAFKGLSAEEATALLGLKRSGEHDSGYYRFNVSGKLFPTGWYVIVLKKHTARKDFIASLSAKSDIMSGEIEEHVMFNSSEYGTRINGFGRWFETAKRDPSILRQRALHPPEFERLKQEAVHQAFEPESPDTLFSIPSHLAARITGFAYEAADENDSWEDLQGNPKGFSSLKKSCLLFLAVALTISYGLIPLVRWLHGKFVHH